MCSSDLGVFARAISQKNTKRTLLAIDIRKSVITLLEDRAKAEGLSNLVAIHASAERCLEDLIKDEQLANVYVFHPDPWFKKRHHKRRVINESSLRLLYRKLKKGGRLYISTDVQLLWNEMALSIQHVDGFHAVNDDAFWETYYTTHWDRFSEQDGRVSYRGVFEKV